MTRARHESADWDRAAPAYARQEHWEHQAIRRALDLLDPSADEALLDVATGTGLVLRELAGRAAPPRLAIGVDRSAGMLARVGPLPAGWRTLRGDATALPLPDASADVAVAAYLLQLLGPAGRAAALGELRRVVRPGGRLVLVTTWSPRPWLRAAFDALAAAVPDAFAGLHATDPRPELAEAGWRPGHAAVLRRGYPSLVVLARRA